MQPLRTSATQRAATITPGLFAPVISVITITGIGDHLRPEWPITFTGIHEGSTRSRETNAGCGTVRDVVEA
jgi:hypothetical protein